MHNLLLKNMGPMAVVCHLYLWEFYADCEIFRSWCVRLFLLLQLNIWMLLSSLCVQVFWLRFYRSLSIGLLPKQKALRSRPIRMETSSLCGLPQCLWGRLDMHLLLSIIGPIWFSVVLRSIISFLTSEWSRCSVWSCCAFERDFLLQLVSVL